MKKNIIYLILLFFVNINHAFSESDHFHFKKNFTKEKIKTLSLQEKKHLNNFFKRCFQSSGFGYTIFGQKPMSTGGLLTENGRPHVDQVKNIDDERVSCGYYMKEGLDVWDKHFKNMDLKEFSFISYPVPGHPNLLHFDIINHNNFLRIVEDHLFDFQNFLSFKISAKEILKEYVKGEGDLFEKINKHDGFLGILLGYGKENSFKFFKGDKLSPLVEPSSLVGKDMSEILLPLFMVSKNSKETHEIMSSFEKQWEKINKIYQSENFLEMVLQKLFTGEENTPSSQLLTRNI